MTPKALLQSLLMALLIAPAAAGATAVRVLSRDASLCTSGVVHAQPACDGCAAEAVSAPWTAHGGAADVVLSLSDAAPQWRVQAEAERCWSAAVVTPPGTEGVLLRVLPAARLSVALVPPRGGAPPENVQLRITGVREGEIPESLIDCQRAEDRWQCSVPAAELDVRVSARGFAPQYLWGIHPSRGRTLDAGTLQLRRGGTLVGRVTVSARNAPAPVEVTLAPERYGTSPRDLRKVMTVRPNDRGFFHFPAVEPGEWTVVATSRGWSPARTTVKIEDSSETALPRPLILEPLATLEMNIEPARDPGGTDWNVRLEQMPEWGQRMRVAERPSSGGSWTAAGLEAGMYLITITAADGAVVHQGGQVISHGMPPLPIRIGVTAVRGTVRLGGDPIEARLAFLQAGGRKAELRSAADGTFSGYLPGEARFAWSVKVTPAGTTAAVQVRNVSVVPVDGVARVDLDLPDGRIAGTVVDQTGQPVRATLRVRGEAVSVDASTASDGTFTVRGLPLGKVELQAWNKTGDSGFVEHTVRGEDDDPITIVTPPRLRVYATVVTPAGQPYAGALVRVLRSGRSIVEEVTGPSGRFPIQSPAQDTTAYVVVLAPGYGTTMQVVSLTGDDRDRRIVLPAASGTVMVPAIDPAKWPYIGREGMPPLDLYNWIEPPPGSSRRRVNGGRILDLEPGPYRFCTDVTLQVCVTHVVAAGSQQAIEFPQ